MTRALVLAPVFALLVAAGCKQDCTPTSCPGGMFCSAGECVAQCVAAADCLASGCDPQDDCCESGVSCNTAGRCVANTSPAECDAPPVLPADGWDDPPGTGVTFIVSQISIGPPESGVNLDGRCDDNGCIDHALSRLGELMNDQIRQGLLGGESLMLLEIAGLTPDYAGFDRSVTVKLYSARDADDPFFPANNFKIPPGHTECCEFLVNRASLEGSGRIARARIAARIRHGRIESVEARTMPWPLAYCPEDTMELSFEQAVFTAVLPYDLTALDQVAFSGALPSSNLHSIDNPYCKTVSPRCPVVFTDSSMDDLIRSLIGQPDIDLDGDGIECAYDRDGDGTVDLCCDGADNRTCGTEQMCLGAAIPSPEASQPELCRTLFADAYSVTLNMSGLPAKVVGTH